MREKSFWVDLAETAIIAVILAFVLKAYVIETTLVNGPSMEPTLYTGERLWSLKFIYRFTTPKRGEIVVFQYPLDPKRDFVKRVIAVAGDKVEVRNGRAYVNGNPVVEKYVKYPGGPDYPPTLISKGYIFVMGDNRRNSDDSRTFGPVPLKNLKGHPFLRYWPVKRTAFVH